MKVKNSVLYTTLAFLMTMGIATMGFASDLAFYSGPTNPGWISDGAVAQNVDAIENDGDIKAIFEKIENFGDGDEVGDKSPLALWTVAHTGNGQQDVLITASGTTPSALYPFPNKKPDGSNVENFIEAGNVVINVADWIFYMSYEGGVRSADNAAAGAANVYDIPGLTFGNRGGVQKVNDLGKKYIPSMKDFQSARPWHLEQFDGTDWDVTCFAEADKQTADPCVAVSKSPGKDGTGMIAAMWQKDAPVWQGKDIRGVGVTEFIVNWLTENGDLAPAAVDPQDKMATTWARVKSEKVR